MLKVSSPSVTGEFSSSVVVGLGVTPVYRVISTKGGCHASGGDTSPVALCVPNNG